MKKELLELYGGINDILASWNPINVPMSIASDEYNRFVPEIFRTLQKKEDLVTCLEGILKNELCLEYDSNNRKQRKDIEELSKKIFFLWEDVGINDKE